MALKFQRIAPGQKNTWYIEILGTKASARFSTRNANRLKWLEYKGGDQVWGTVEAGHITAYRTVTGSIFEFGFSDSVLQMWAAFVHELVLGKAARRFSACSTLAEAELSHRLFTAALNSQRNRSVEPVCAAPV